MKRNIETKILVGYCKLCDHIITNDRGEHKGTIGYCSNLCRKVGMYMDTGNDKWLSADEAHKILYKVLE